MTHATLSGRLYLDHAATTPILPKAREAMLRALESCANPSSPHADGRAAPAALEDARARIAAAPGWHDHVLFTSGASQAVRMGGVVATTVSVRVDPGGGMSIKKKTRKVIK